jgi:hypothetical protein
MHGVLRCTPHVRFGSKAAATVLTVGVRFTPESVHERGRTARPLWAASRAWNVGHVVTLPALSPAISSDHLPKRAPPYALEHCGNLCRRGHLLQLSSINTRDRP